MRKISFGWNIHVFNKKTITISRNLFLSGAKYIFKNLINQSHVHYSPPLGNAQRHPWPDPRPQRGRSHRRGPSKASAKSRTRARVPATAPSGTTTPVSSSSSNRGDEEEEEEFDAETLLKVTQRFKELIEGKD